MTPEGKIVADIKALVSRHGGQVRKCEWAGRRGAPDLFVMLNGAHSWIEVKTPRGRVTALQNLEHEIMRNCGGCRVAVCRSVAEAADFLGVPRD